MWHTMRVALTGVAFQAPEKTLAFYAVFGMSNVDDSSGGWAYPWT
jgi:hypothetical protein